MLSPSRADEALATGVVIGILAEPDRGAAVEAAATVEQGLKSAFPDLRALTVVLSGTEEGATPPEALPAQLRPGEPAPAVYTGGHGDPAAALPTLLEVAAARNAPACVLLEPLPRTGDPGWIRALLGPVLTGGFDLVAPAYARGRFDGVLVTGIVYPLTRALFGQRLRQPLGREVALSARLAQILLRDEDWQVDPGVDGADIWLATKALAGDCRVAQVFIGPRPRPASRPADAPTLIARIVGALFNGMERHAAAWQRVRGSRPVPTYGDEHLPDGGPAPSPGPLLSSWTLGWSDLRSLWSAVLSPQTLLALQRLPVDRPEAFRLPDPLWARVIYDFAVGWRVKAMERGQLLRSLTPLYLGWVASFVNEVAPLAPDEAETRIERLCAAFEAEKPYLISRWRWPDRFAP